MFTGNLVDFKLEGDLSLTVIQYLSIEVNFGGCLEYFKNQFIFKHLLLFN